MPALLSTAIPSAGGEMQESHGLKWPQLLCHIGLAVRLHGQDFMIVQNIMQSLSKWHSVHPCIAFLMSLYFYVFSHKTGSLVVLHEDHQDSAL